MADASKVVISGITRFSIVQALKWIEVEYNKFARNTMGEVKLVSGVDKLRQLDSIEDRTGNANAAIKKDIQYPFALAAIGDISLDTERAGFKKNRANNGIISFKDLDTGKVFLEDVRPIKLAIGLAFRCDSLDDVLSMATVLLYNAPKVAFIMRGAGGFTVETSLSLDGTFSTPDYNTDTGESYIFNTILTLNTHIGMAKQMGMIRQLKFSVLNQDGIESVFGEGDPELLFSSIIDYTELFTPGSAYYKKGSA